MKKKAGKKTGKLVICPASELQPLGEYRHWVCPHDLDGHCYHNGPHPKNEACADYKMCPYASGPCVPVGKLSKSLQGREDMR